MTFGGDSSHDFHKIQKTQKFSRFIWIGERPKKGHQPRPLWGPTTQPYFITETSFKLSTGHKTLDFYQLNSCFDIFYGFFTKAVLSFIYDLIFQGILLPPDDVITCSKNWVWRTMWKKCLSLYFTHKTFALHGPYVHHRIAVAGSSVILIEMGFMHLSEMPLKRSLLPVSPLENNLKTAPKSWLKLRIGGCLYTVTTFI